MQLWKLGCRWKENYPLFYDFIVKNKIVIGWIDMDYQVGDWLLITDGYTVLAFAEVKGKRDCILSYPEKKQEIKQLKIPYTAELFIYNAEFIELDIEDRFRYSNRKGIVRVHNPDSKEIFEQLKTKYKAMKEINNVLEILKYKKQIILQGPPGTGKTKLAKEIAYNLANIKKDFSPSEISSLLTVGESINTVTNYNSFTVIEKTKSGIKVKPLEAKNSYNLSFKEIAECINNEGYKKAVKESESNGTGSYKVAVAKHLIDLYYKINSTIKLVQFHPSYSYEDFVRGIEAIPKGTQVEYKSKNKMLAEFALEAKKNFENSRKAPDQLSKERWISEKLKQITGFIQKKLVEDGKYYISGKVYIYEIEEDCYRYKGDEWSYPGRINFIDVQKIILANFESKEVKGVSESISTHAFYRQSYYLPIVKLFFDTVGEYKGQTEESETLKNYVLIIDEINRANLSSVLGELIYALEYRDEAVESMYKVDDSNEIILPSNFYLIGTMNTADRSVGHIDYAIRRRFAFVDVIPKDLTADLGAKFSSSLFAQVAKLFDHSTHLSNEFDPKDVQLGHSYFIDKSESGGSMAIRLEYEIKPILIEYVKDGILIGEGIEQLISDLKL